MDWRDVARSTFLEVPCKPLAFMPVGTYGTVKGMLPRDITEIGAEITCNTFHLWLRPGTDIIKAHGDLTTSWGGKANPDRFRRVSGIQSGCLAEGDRGGSRFQITANGDRVFLIPETSMRIQRDLGSDIVMIFDECTPHPATEAEAERSMQLSLRWAERSRQAHGDTLRRCSALSRAACIQNCACVLWKV